MIAVGGAGPDSSVPAASCTSASVSGVYITFGRRPSARDRRRKWPSRSGSAIRSRGADTNATDEWPSSARRCMGRLTAAALSGPTRETPGMLSAVAFSATTGAAPRGDLPHVHGLALQRVARVEDEHGGPGRVGDLLGPAEHVEEERVGEVPDHEAVRGGAPPAQRLGLRVGPVAELLRGGQDALSGVLGHSGLAVQREAGRGHRDASQPGHLTNPARLLWPAVVTRHVVPGLGARCSAPGGGALACARTADGSRPGDMAARQACCLTTRASTPAVWGNPPRPGGCGTRRAIR